MGEWQTIVDDPPVWSTEYPVHGWSGRTTAIGRAGGELVVYNPGATISPEMRTTLSRYGRVALLVAPNHFHHLGIPAWRDAFPSALVLASTLAIPRLRDRGIEATGYDGIALPAGAHFLEPVGLKNGEVWISLPSARGRVWIVGDAFFNVVRTPRNATGVLLRLTGTTPGLRIGSTVKWLAIGQPRAYRGWLEDTLVAEQPEVLIPAHGSVLRDANLHRRLARLAAARL